jgi:hypothetical protein
VTPVVTRPGVTPRVWSVTRDTSPIHNRRCHTERTKAPHFGGAIRPGARRSVGSSRTGYDNLIGPWQGSSLQTITSTIGRDFSLQVRILPCTVWCGR